MPKSKFLSRLAVLLATACLASMAAACGPGRATGTGWDTFGAPGNGINQFAGPTGIFVIPTGQIFVADGRNSRVIRINDMAGTGWTTFGTRGTGINQFRFPFGIFVNSTGQIFVADIDRIIRIDDMAGTGWTTFGTRGRGTNQFGWLTGIFVSPTGEILGADAGNNRIVRISDIAGSGWTTLGSSGSGVNQFSQPLGVFVSTTGQIFVADAGNHRLVRINDMNGTGWTTFDTHTIRGADHWYWSPTGIFVSPAGQIFMTDLGNQRIVRINDMFGTGRAMFNTVGPCTHTWSPGIFVRARGEIFVADYANSRILHATDPLEAPEPQPGNRHAPNCTPPLPGRPATPLSTVDPVTAADEARGIYKGPLGEFEVTPQQSAAYPPCPLPVRRTQNFKASELYSPVFGENLEVYECANGKIVSIGLIGGPAMGRGYFIGPAKVPYEGPFDRLVLLTVGGHPAIAQLPHPAFPGSLRMAVIQRVPSGNEPGILVWIDESGRSLKETAALAARIMGVQP